MNTPRYVVRRIGGDYRILRSDAQGVISSSLCVLGGIGLATFGVARRFGLLSISTFLAGAGLIYYGVTGNNPVQQLSGCMKKDPLTQSAGPSHQHSEGLAPDQRPTDVLDEVAMESFPASDAPSTTAATSKV